MQSSAAKVPGSDGQCRYGNRNLLRGTTLKALYVNFVLLGVGDDIDESCALGGLQGDGGEGVECEDCATRGVGESLGGHHANSQAGVAARTATHGDGLHIPRLPANLLQRVGDGRGQIVRMAVRLVEPCVARTVVPSVNATEPTRPDVSRMRKRGFTRTFIR